MSKLTELLTNVANAIRNLKGTTEPINAQNFPSEINSMRESLDDTTATSSDIVIGKTAYSKGEKITGTYKANTFKKYLDENKSAYHLFYYSNISDFTDYISYEDTSNVTNMNQMFCYSKATIIPPLDTRKVTYAPEMFSGCTNLITVSELDFIGVDYSGYHNMFNNCKKLTNLKILNIQKGDLQVGSGSSWGHLLTLESLLGLCQQCRYQWNTWYTLTVGTANLEKLANVYVKLRDSYSTTYYEFDICESTDDGAMTISEYMQLKYWKLA